MPKPASTAPARSPVSLQAHLEELRAEFANCLDRAERRQIEQEMRAAEAELKECRNAT